MHPGPPPPGQKSPVSIGNGSHWKDVDEFTLLQAACLWAGIEPLDSFQDLRCSPEATARYHLLTQAVRVGDLKASHPSPAPRTVKVAFAGQHAPEMLVSRDDLKELANAIGEQPLFLFPASNVDSTPLTDSRRYSQAAVKHWYQLRVKTWPTSKAPPTRDEDWDAAKQEGFPNVPRAILRNLRKKYAPEVWTKKGPRRR